MRTANKATPSPRHSSNNMQKKLLYIITILFSLTTVTAQENVSALIPIPNNVSLPKGKNFQIEKSGILTKNIDINSFCVKELKRILKEHTGIEPPFINNKKSPVIEIAIDSTIKGKEHYTLDIGQKKLSIKASSNGGIFYALQTLNQILIGDKKNTCKGEIAPIAIDDSPRYAHRAVMLDPARHFLPVEDVKLFIDQMAKYKYNILQLHLTDDQGWRIEIKSHPALTKTGAFRNPSQEKKGPDNGYYTQEEIKDLIEYASERNIEIIPELDIPGHSVAILAAYPYLGCKFRQKEVKTLGETTNMMLCADCDEAYIIYEDIIREIAELFPSEYIHLGGDEAAVKENWAKCEDCLKLMHESGYNEPSQLMNIFFGKMLNIVRRNNKKAILWCELDNIWPPATDYLFPYPADVTLVTWRNALTPKCIELTRNNGHNLIMAPGEHTYLDYPQYKNDLPEYGNWGMPVTTLEQCYKLDPGYGLKKEEQSHILGVMATLWAEAIKDINRVNYMFFPRGLAVAEAGWSNMCNRNWQSFKERLYPNLYELMKAGISFRVPFEIAPTRNNP